MMVTGVPARLPPPTSDEGHQVSARNGRTNKPATKRRTPKKDAAVIETSAVEVEVEAPQKKSPPAKVGFVGKVKEALRFTSIRESLAPYGGFLRWARGWFWYLLLGYLIVFVVNSTMFRIEDKTDDVRQLTLIVMVLLPGIVLKAFIRTAKLWKWFALALVMTGITGDSALIVLLFGAATLLRREMLCIRKLGFRWTQPMMEDTPDR
jgi:hypothetical protein